MKYLNALLLALLLGFASCNDDDVPAAENEEEVIDKVVLTFTPAGGTALEFVAIDPDGEGSADFEKPPIELAANETYTLSIGVFNNEEGEDIGAEILEEADEHMFFFGFTAGLFSSPVGDGNIGAGSRGDELNYDDEDANGFPLGLETIWQTGAAKTGTFRVILKHQPDIKSATSSSTEGESDIDLEWNITVE